MPLREQMGHIIEARRQWSEAMDEWAAAKEKAKQAKAGVDEWAQRLGMLIDETEKGLPLMKATTDEITADEA